MSKVLQIALLTPDWPPAWVDPWLDSLESERFAWQHLAEPARFGEHVLSQGDRLDCLVLVLTDQAWGSLQQLTQHWCQQGILLPTVLLLATDPYPFTQALTEAGLYHNAVIVASMAAITPKSSPPLPESPPPLPNWPDLALLIDQAIAKFLQMSPLCLWPHQPTEPVLPFSSQLDHHLQAQRQRLAEKLRERLGYLGVYYKRDPSQFYRALPAPDQTRFMQRLRGLYQALMLDYFRTPAQANRRIDEFVALAFLGDLSVSQVLELHMGLIDDYAKQLKLEGRSEEILLDYRITLIDVLAHLSEMYRRSIPRTDPPPSLTVPRRPTDRQPQPSAFPESAFPENGSELAPSPLSPPTNS